MKTLFRSLLLTAALAFFLIPGSVRAATEAWSYQELPYIWCVNYPDYSNSFCPPFNRDAKWIHRARLPLEQFTFPASTEIMIVQCIEAGEDLDNDGTSDPVCTTGSSSLDKELFCGDPNTPDTGCDNLTYLQQNPKIKYRQDGPEGDGYYHLTGGNVQKVFPTKITTDAQGKASVPVVEWQSYTEELTKRSFYVVFPNGLTSATLDEVDETGVGGRPQRGVGGHQQDTLTFPTTAPLTAGKLGVNPSMVRHAWDPRGRVFDATTLEPLNAGKVTLLQKNTAGTFNAGYASQQNPLIRNPFPTDNSGIYIFYVVNGVYSMQPEYAGYRHPSTAEAAQMHPNAKKIYTAEHYLNDSPAVVEAGAVEYRDIPMMTVSGAGSVSDIKVYSEKREVNDSGQLVYSGIISHPYAELEVQLCKMVEGTETCKNPMTYTHLNGGPNNEGIYAVVFNQQILEPGEYIIRTFKKRDLRSLPLSKKAGDAVGAVLSRIIPGFAVQAADAMPNRGKIQPIPTYLEGFAYDSAGKVLANATVELRRAGVKTPLFTTTTDANGFYKITSDYTPKESYHIAYITASGAEVIIPTSTFLAQNSEHYAVENIDPYKIVMKDTDPRAGYVPSQSKAPSVQVAAAEKMAENTPVEQESNGMLIALIITLVVIIIGFIGYFLYMKKQQTMPNKKV